MSKQSDAKASQHYIQKPTPAACGNCHNFRSSVEYIDNNWTKMSYRKESNLRCGIGGFKVTKTATCREWSPRIPTTPPK